MVNSLKKGMGELLQERSVTCIEVVFFRENYSFPPVTPPPPPFIYLYSSFNSLRIQNIYLVPGKTGHSDISGSLL